MMRTAQDDKSLVCIKGKTSDYSDSIITFSLVDGKLAPSFSKHHSVIHKYLKLENFELFAGKLLYAVCIDFNNHEQNMAVFNSDMESEDIDWQEANDELLFVRILAVPGYNTANNPYCIALTDD